MWLANLLVPDGVDNRICNGMRGFREREMLTIEQTGALGRASKFVV